MLYGAPSRYVVVDDTDSRINYEGQWSLDTSGNMDGSNWSDRGPTWNHTLTRAQGEASFSFRFNGTYFHIYGSYDIKNKKPAPKWRCQVDDTTIDNTRIPSSPAHANFFGFCRHAVQAGEHTITLNVTVPLDGYFWLDHIDYAPSLPPTKNEVMLYQDHDTSVIYEPHENWKVGYGASDKATSIAGSTITINFSGVQFTAYGSARGNTTNTAHYSIDDGSPVNFIVPSSPPGVGGLSGQPLFTASNLSLIDHKIVITFTGDTKGAPLDFGYAMITLPPGVDRDLPSPPHRGSGPPVGAIVGGVVGGLVGLVLLVCLCMFLRERARRKRAELGDTSEATPFDIHYVDDSISRNNESHDLPGSKRSALLNLIPRSRLSQLNYLNDGRRIAQSDPINDTPPQYREQ